MARTRKIKISAELYQLVEYPVELENPDELEAIQQWNDLVPKYMDADEFDQFKMLPELRIAAGRVLYGGMDPKTVPPDDMLYLMRQEPGIENYGPSDQQFRERFVERIKGPLTGIRAYCVIRCMNGQPGFVRACESTTCSFWPFRMGNNPFFGKLPDAEAAVTEEPDEEPADAHQEA